MLPNLANGNAKFLSVCMCKCIYIVHVHVCVCVYSGKEWRIAYGKGSPI